MRQEYSLSTLQEILNQYLELGKIKKHFLFTSGFENSNYYVETSQGKYVIKIFEGIGMSKENILFEIEVMAYCQEHKLKTPHLLTTKKGAYFTTIKSNEEKIVTVMGYIDGENMLMKLLPDSVIATVGEEAGKMDLKLQHFQDGSKTRQGYEWDMKNFLKVEKALAVLPATFDKKILQNIFDNFREISPKFKALAPGLIHNDLAAHNLLVQGEELKGIIDFSDMAFSPYIQNIAIFLAQSIFSYSWKPHQTTIFLREYQKHRPLSTEELEILYDLVLARYATIIVEFNRWNVDYGEDKQRTEYIKDYQAFLQKFLKISREEFARLLEV
ncbi:homoserine kinase [Candidatus Woesearchaeota archaeon]|nr:homoserine kinase [Candidatus Woesearchaeota archaeon]